MSAPPPGMPAIPDGLTPTKGIPFSVIHDSIAIAFASLSFPLIVILLWVAKPAHWRRLPPWICIFSFILTAAAAVNTVVINQVPLMHPLSNVPRSREMFNITVLYLLPWVSDLAITLRLFAIFPIRWTPTSTLVCVFAFPVTLKLVRLGMAFWYLNVMDGVIQRTQGFADLGRANKVLPVNFAEYAAKVADITYASVLFFMKVRGTIEQGDERGVHRSRQVRLKLQRLLLITAGCYFVPVLSSAAMITTAAIGKYEPIAYMTVINSGVNMVNVLLGVLLPMVGILDDETAAKEAKAACESKFEAASMTHRRSSFPPKELFEGVTRPTTADSRVVHPDVVHIHPPLRNGESIDLDAQENQWERESRKTSTGVMGQAAAAPRSQYSSGSLCGSLARRSTGEGEYPLDDFGPSSYGSAQSRRSLARHG